MTKIDVISGFLGAGKTTLIKKLIQEGYGNERIVLIENEFGEIGIDGGFLKEAGITIKEMNSGCICCSLVGDFALSLEKVMEQFTPERIIIEPSGVGKLSDVLQAIRDLHDDRFVLNAQTTIVDGKKALIYMKNFGEFFNNQVEYATTIIISRTQQMRHEQVQEVVTRLKEHNDHANIIVTPWDDLSGKKILETMEHTNELAKEMMKELDICPICHHHHEHGDDSHTHCHEAHHETHHEHKAHHEIDHEHDAHHPHEHHHDHHCGCDHEHHHHHADDIFIAWGKETLRMYQRDELEEILKKLSEQADYGTILRAKGMLAGEDHTWLYFDLVPGEYEIRCGDSETIGKLCVIGSELDETALETLFGLDR